MVPRAGIEPARYFYRGILSPLRLPISPPGHIRNGLVQTACILWEVDLDVNLLLNKNSKRMHKVVNNQENKENGGESRSRTELHGFAIQCITALLTRQIDDYLYIG